MHDIISVYNTTFNTEGFDVKEGNTFIFGGNFNAVHDVNDAESTASAFSTSTDSAAAIGIAVNSVTVIDNIEVQQEGEPVDMPAPQGAFGFQKLGIEVDPVQAAEGKIADDVAKYEGNFIPFDDVVAGGPGLAQVSAENFVEQAAAESGIDTFTWTDDEKKEATASTVKTAQESGINFVSLSEEYDKFRGLEEMYAIAVAASAAVSNPTCINMWPSKNLDYNYIIEYIDKSNKNTKLETIQNITIFLGTISTNILVNDSTGVNLSTFTVLLLANSSADKININIKGTVFNSTNINEKNVYLTRTNFYYCYKNKKIYFYSGSVNLNDSDYGSLQIISNVKFFQTPLKTNIVFGEDTDTGGNPVIDIYTNPTTTTTGTDTGTDTGTGTGTGTDTGVDTGTGTGTGTDTGADTGTGTNPTEDTTVTIFYDQYNLDQVVMYGPGSIGIKAQDYIPNISYINDAEYNLTIEMYLEQTSYGSLNFEARHSNGYDIILDTEFNIEQVDGTSFNSNDVNKTPISQYTGSITVNGLVLNNLRQTNADIYISYPIVYLNFIGTTSGTGDITQDNYSVMLSVFEINFFNVLSSDTKTNLYFEKLAVNDDFPNALIRGENKFLINSGNLDIVGDTNSITLNTITNDIGHNVNVTNPTFLVLLYKDVSEMGEFETSYDMVLTLQSSVEITIRFIKIHDYIGHSNTALFYCKMVDDITINTDNITLTINEPSIYFTKYNYNGTDSFKLIQIY